MYNARAEFESNDVETFTVRVRGLTRAIDAMGWLQSYSGDGGLKNIDLTTLVNLFLSIMHPILRDY